MSDLHVCICYYMYVNVVEVDHRHVNTKREVPIQNILFVKSLKETSYTQRCINNIFPYIYISCIYKSQSGGPYLQTTANIISSVA